MSLLNDFKDFFKTGRFEILPKIDASDEVKNKVSELVEYVYSKGKLPRKEMPSKKYQKHLLAQVYSMTEINEYKDLVNPIYEAVIAKKNPYIHIEDEEDFFAQMHFAMETLCYNIIRLSKDGENSREYWNIMDNMSERLLQMDHEKFKTIYILIHEWHFGYVYKFDSDYKFQISEIKKRLRVYHGIKQADFYEKISASKEDIQITLYFGEKAGEIKRVQEGNTYRLYLPGDNVDEIKKYEFTRGATTDGDFSYKKYWKEVAKKIKENEGILQTDFYKLFSWDSEVVTCVLREAEKENLVTRKKKGNTYLLFMPKACIVELVFNI